MTHVPEERLIAVAKEDLTFTQQEFAHLRICAECLNRWAELIRQRHEDEEKDQNSN
jgi:hypothetical protein